MQVIQDKLTLFLGKLLGNIVHLFLWYFAYDGLKTLQILSHCRFVLAADWSDCHEIPQCLYGISCVYLFQFIRDLSLHQICMNDINTDQYLFEYHQSIKTLNSSKERQCSPSESVPFYFSSWGPPQQQVQYFLSISQMSVKTSLDPLNRSLKPTLSSKELSTGQKTPFSKHLQRKPHNLAIPSHEGSGNHSKEHNEINNSRYIIKTPATIVGFNHSVTSSLEHPAHQAHDVKTERKEVNEKSGQKSGKQKRYNDDCADYYKYWKKKANQYQQINFNLHRHNSALQEENQILKHKLQKMQKKLIKIEEPEPVCAVVQVKNYEKLESYYRSKVDQLSRKIEEQQLYIAKQEEKIKELSQCRTENNQLKNILDNMEEKLSEMKSMGSRDSRAGSIERDWEKDQMIKPKNTMLGMDIKKHPILNKASYSIVGGKKSQNFNYLQIKSNSNRKI